MNWRLQEVANGWLLSKDSGAEHRYINLRHEWWIAATPTAAAKIVEAEEKKAETGARN